MVQDNKNWYVPLTEPEEKEDNNTKNDNTIIDADCVCGPNQQQLLYEEPYVKIPIKEFTIKKDYLYPYVEAGIFREGNLYGDALRYDLTEVDVKFKLYDSSDRIITIGNAEKTNEARGEVRYKWKNFETSKRGNFYGVFVLSITENNNTITKELNQPYNRIPIFII